MLEIARAVPSDSDRLIAIAIEAKAHWGYAPDWMAAWGRLLQLPAAYMEENLVYKGMANGRIAGWYAVVLEQSHGLLDHLWGLPRSMGQGIGRRLFTHAMELAKASGIARLELEADPHAVGFYEHMGAKVIGEHHSEMERMLPLMAIEL